VEQLSAMDASFLYLETPRLPQHVLGVILLDRSETEGGFSEQTFRKMLEDRIHLMPSFERTLLTVPFAVDHPHWVHDHDVVLDDHLHATTCPAPGDLHALGRLVGELGAVPLDRSRPLWEMWVVDGLADGRVALIAKLHHCTMYGSAGANMMGYLLDLSPEIRIVEAREPVPIDQHPSTVGLLAKAGGQAIRRPARAARFAFGGLRKAGALGGSVGRSVVQRAPVSVPFAAPRSAINGRLTRDRQAAFTSVDFADITTIKNAFGVKVNDVVLAATATALRNYLLAHGGLPKRPLIASVPIQTGAGEVEGTDKISAMLVPLPLTIEDPTERLAAIAEASMKGKGFSDTLGADTIGELADLVPPLLIQGGSRLYERFGLSRLHPPLQSLVISNMPGPPIPLYCAGSRVDAVYPLGPLLAGSGLNVTVLSNMGKLDVGLLCCPDIVGDVWKIADGFPAAVAELLAASP
jgi:diacylglycerol O-acyltransferase